MLKLLQEIFVAAKVTLTLGFLFYASWRDFKVREVSNRVWAYYAPIALALSLAELLLFAPAQLPYLGLSFGLTAGFSLLLFYSGGFGGADAKALMCIALALPFAPLALFTPLLANGVSPLSEIIFPLTIFSNSVLFAAASGIYMIMRNVVWHKKNGAKMFAGTLTVESWGKKLLVLITGYKVTVAKLKEKWHVFPMEDLQQETDDALKRKLVIVPREEGRDQIVNRLSNAVEAGKIENYVWATPGLPMLIFVTLGLVTALLFGDIVWLLVRAVLG